MSEKNVEIVRAALEAFRRGDVDQALEHVHPDMVSTRVDPDGAVFHGRDGLLALMADWTEGFEEWSYQAEEFFDGGEQVVVRLHQWGRGAGSGVPVDGDNWLTYFFEDAMVTRFSIFSDREQAFASVGLSSEAARPSP
jgi:ketosteroid isomerase-like protein